MKNLQDFLIEAATPKFANNTNGIKEFCEYVFGEAPNVKWIVNPDDTITVKCKEVPGNGVQCVYMWTKDLTEIPNFITFSNIEDITLGIDNKKIKSWSPNVNGTCAGIIVDNDTKLEILDLTNCDCKGGKLFIEKNKKLKTIKGGNGDGVQVYVAKNKDLINLDLSKYRNCKTPGSYISNNKSLDLTKAKYPKEIVAK